MARIDDYKEAVELGTRALKGKDPERLALQSGAGLERAAHEKMILTLDFLNRKVAVSWPDLEFSSAGDDEEITIQQRILLLHYLNGSQGSRTTGDWIAYQEVPDGRFYLDAFQKRAKGPMLRAFGEQPQLLPRLAAALYSATPFQHGDFSVALNALPLVPVALILWEGDDEFPPEGNILFDRSISSIFSAEDIAWLAGMIIYPLVGMAKQGP